MRAIAVASLALAVLAGAPAQAGKYNIETKEITLVEPEDGHALLYVIRTSKGGMAVTMWTFVDETFVGVTRGPGYTFAQVPPGRRMIWTKAENVAALDVDLEAGKTYYMKQVVLPGFGKARTRVEMLTEAEGIAAIKKAKKRSEPTAKAEEKAGKILEEQLDRAREKAAKKESD